MDAKKRREILVVAGVAVLCIVAGVAGAAVFASLGLEPSTLKEWLGPPGPLAALIFLGLQVAQILVFFLPGEAMHLAGGLVFGFWPGFFLSLGGNILGGFLAFWLARRLGSTWVDGWLKSKEYTDLVFLRDHPRLGVILGVLFVLPLLPKDFLCYLAGLSRIGAWRFLVITSLARIPPMLLSTEMGVLSDRYSWLPLVLTLVLAVAVSLVFTLGRVRLAEWFRKGAVKGEGGNPGMPG